MDPDVFPNSIEYWGPNGMVFFRNVQVRWTPWQDGDSRFAVALERPGASADQGVYAGRIELEGVTARFPLPDLSAHFRYAGGWGHVQVAGILRQIKWDDLNDDQFDLERRRHGLGHQPQHEPQAQQARLPRLGGLRRGRPELLERRARWTSASRTTSRIPGPRRRQGAADPRHRRVPRPQLERRVDEHGRLLDGGHRQQRRAGGQRLQEGAVRARQHPVPPDAGRDPGAGDPVGQARELPGRLHVRRRPDPVLGQVQLQVSRWEASDERLEDGA